MHPRSPYGVAKVCACLACVIYRRAFDLFISNGILFNSKSERRRLEFVTRKIGHGVAQNARDRATKPCLGNLGAMRDWRNAP
jgi:GDPmannose 4,6-dehydratase